MDLGFRGFVAAGLEVQRFGQRIYRTWGLGLRV